MANPQIRSRKRPPALTYLDNALASGGVFHDNLRVHIEYRAPAELRPPKRILRQHSDRQLKQTEASYQPALTTTHAPICGVRWS